MKDIPNFDAFVKIEPIHKGWSGDKKYYAETLLSGKNFSIGTR